MSSVRFNDTNFDEIAGWQRFFSCRFNILCCTEYKWRNGRKICFCLCNLTIERQYIFDTQYWGAWICLQMVFKTQVKKYKGPQLGSEKFMFLRANHITSISGRDKTGGMYIFYHPPFGYRGMQRHSGISLNLIRQRSDLTHIKLTDSKKGLTETGRCTEFRIQDP